jgi:PAS domain S-box-containing protein
MRERRRGPELDLLVVTDDGSFGGAVVDAVEGTGAASAERVEPVTGEPTRCDTGGVDGAIVDGQIAEPAAVVERLTERANLPVVVLSESAGDDTVARAIGAGATDVFPRTTASAQYELAVERLAGDDSSGSTRPLPEGEATYQQAYEALFEKISEGLVVHDPETGVIVDANERFCEMNGYERSALLGEPAGVVMTEGEAYGPDAAKEMIQRGRTDGPQHFEWRNQHRNGETFPVEVDLTVIELDGTERVLASVRDITERKRREREYEQIFDGVKDPIAVFDPDTGRVTDVNEPYHDMIGYDDLETIQELGIGGLSAEQTAYTAERGAELIREVSDTGDPMTVEWEAETASGDRRYLEITLSPAVIRGEERVLTIQRDVTERKRREREYEQIFNSVQDAITVHDPQTGAMVDVNDTFCDLVGYDRETILEMGTAGISVEAEGYTQEYATEIMAEVISEGQKGPYEWMVATKDGERRTTEVVATKGTIGGAERIISINRDITERERRERELEQIFNSVQDAIAVFDPDTLEYLDANEAYLEMFDHESVSELRERGVSGLSITEEGYTEKRGREVHQRVAESGQPETLEWQGETSVGERVWLEVKVTPAVIGGEQRTISIQRDITERRRREQRLEVFNRILRHNLRNQLDVIQSHAEELADRTTDGHAERIVTAVDELAGIGRRARQVDRILSTDDTLTEFDVAETLCGTVEAMDPERSDVAVTTELPGETRLRTDKESITMAVESALENALEHAASAVTVTVEGGPDGCVITIADDGVGIPEAELIPIEAETEKRLRHGRGLGLWQLRWCVDNLNGQLSFETDGGTTVRISVPDRRESGRPG